MLRGRLETHSDDDAMAGLAHAGWRLYYDEQPTETFRQEEAELEVSNLDYSIGLQVHSDGVVRSVVWDGPAFIAGLAPGARITAVNGQPFALTELEQAVKTANSSALSLTFEINGAGQTAVIDYEKAFVIRTWNVFRAQSTGSAFCWLLGNDRQVQAIGSELASSHPITVARLPLRCFARTR
jgi:hypothetical protein